MPATHSRSSDWQRQALERLRDDGLRAGGARTAVIEALAAENGCVEAEELAAHLREEGRRIGTASVYRALGLLTEMGLLQKVALPDSPARFELVHPDGEHHHHIVCDSCGRTEAFHDEKLEQAIDAVGERSEFAVDSHEITLHGRCRKCSGGKAT